MLRELQTALMELDAQQADAVPVPKLGSEFGLHTFIQHLAQNVSDGQSALDEYSEEYLRKTARKPHLAPTVFRMPKVKAQFRFAMRKSQTRGFNVFLASGKTQKESEQEQMIDFEIVTAPPAVDVVKNIEALGGVDLRLLVIGAEADRIGERLPTLGNMAGAEKLTESWNKRRNEVLALTYGDGETVVIAGVVKLQPEQKLRVWTLKYEDEKPLKRLLDRAAPPGGELLQVLQPVFDRQQRLLDQHKKFVELLASGADEPAT